MNINSVVKGFIAVGTVVLAALGIADFNERRETNIKLGMSMKELKNASAKEIQQTVVESAVRDAAKDSVSDYMRTVKDEALFEARKKIFDETRKAVTEASDVIKQEVSDRISKEASMIDMTSLKNSAREKAEEKILEKFDGNLEDLLSRFNNNLGNVQKIYEAIADTVSKGKDKGNGVKFTFE